MAKVYYESDANLNLLKDKTYLNELINEYWFIDESILNDNIYHQFQLPFEACFLVQHTLHNL